MDTLPFFITVCLDNWQGQKGMKVKVDPETQANTTFLTEFKRLFTHILDSLGNPRRGLFKPTNKVWISHDGFPQPFLDVFHTDDPMSYMTRLYIFEAITILPILLSCAACDRLDILEI